MKILMINSVFGIRSTGRICSDLVNELEKNGHEVKVGYGRCIVPKEIKHKAIKISSKLSVLFHAFIARIFDCDGFGSYFCTKKFLNKVRKFNPSLIILHNLHGYYINVPLLIKYINNYQKKVLFVLHDFWPFTGHSGLCDQISCEKWKEECYDCKLKKLYPKSFFDFSTRNYHLKMKMFNSINNIHFISPSYWLKEKFKESFLSKKEITVIPNGIDDSKFFYCSSNLKTKLNLTNKIILLGCQSSWNQSKGLNDFLFLSKNLKENFVIILVGLTKKQIKKMPSNIICFERTNDVKKLVELYSAADVFLNLSYVDVFSMVNREALMCGTPVITYNTGGCSECLNGKNGLSFFKGDVKGILDFLNNDYNKNLFDLSSKVEKNHDLFTIHKMNQYYIKIINDFFD